MRPIELIAERVVNSYTALCADMKPREKFKKEKFKDDEKRHF
jgi:hypothetical protein